MANMHTGRTTAAIEGEFVVFVIGIRINRPWKVGKWLPVFLAMPKMLRELATNPDSGFLGYTSGPIPTVMIQYWRSFDALEAYARAHDHEHWPAWVAFNKRVGAASGDVGIWHETYRIAPGTWETIYAGMPPIGLGKASALVPLRGGRDRSRGRMGGDLAPTVGDVGRRDAETQRTTREGGGNGTGDTETQRGNEREKI